MGNFFSTEREQQLQLEEQLRQRQQQQRQQQYDLWKKALKEEEVRLEILEQQRQREREEALKRQVKQQQAAAAAAVQRTIRFEYQAQGQPDYAWEDSDYEWDSSLFQNEYPGKRQRQGQQPDSRGLRKPNKQNQPPTGCGRRRRGRKNRGDLYENDYHAGHSKAGIKAMCRERDAAFQARYLKASE